MKNTTGIFLLLPLMVLSGCGASKQNGGSQGSPDASAEDAAAIDAGVPDAGGREPVTSYVDDLKDGKAGSGSDDDPFRDLQAAIDAAGEGDTIRVRQGQYEAAAQSYTDPTCGNCGPEEQGEVEATRGFLISAKKVTIKGDGADRTHLITNAGYGVLIEGGSEVTLSNLRITGGKRDRSGKATDAAVVVRESKAEIFDAVIEDNNDLYEPRAGEDDPIVGIIGIAAREGADLTIYRTKIMNNSWDGIALYQGRPKALIVGNRIGCDRACVSRAGRGVGVGITWDAEALVINNRISGYWKGIGTFGDSKAFVKNNVVANQAGWGVIASGNSYMEAVNNVIYHNGTTGLAAWSPTVTGKFVNNVVAANGWDETEWVGKRTGVWMNAIGDFEVSYNDVWGNEPLDYCAGGQPQNASPCEPIEFIGSDGNISEDPLFEDTKDFKPAEGSPLLDSGDPDILDADGSRSDMGAYGGPDAEKTAP